MIIEQLKSIHAGSFPNIDFAAEKRLMTDGILDSPAAVSVIAEIEDTFKGSVPQLFLRMKPGRVFDAQVIRSYSGRLLRKNLK